MSDVPRQSRVWVKFLKHKPALVSLVIIGLYAFVVGLKLGLFPIGRSMAEPSWRSRFTFATKNFIPRLR